MSRISEIMRERRCGYRQAVEIERAEREAHSLQRPCSDAASKRIELLAAFDAMHDESIAEWLDYVKRCGGTPISKVKP